MAERGGPIVEVTRRYRFSAAHRMHNPRFSAAENARIYGRCNHPHGHGHTYVLAVTVRGAVAPDRPDLSAVTALEAVMAAQLLPRLDQANLDDVLTADDGPTSTTEALLHRCWRVLDAVLPPGSLWRLRIDETPNNAVETDRAERERAAAAG